MKSYQKWRRLAKQIVQKCRIWTQLQRSAYLHDLRNQKYKVRFIFDKTSTRPAYKSTLHANVYNNAYYSEKTQRRCAKFHLSQANAFHEFLRTLHTKQQRQQTYLSRQIASKRYTFTYESKQNPLKNQNFHRSHQNCSKSQTARDFNKTFDISQTLNCRHFLLLRAQHQT